MIFIYVCFFAIAFATTLKEENQALKKTHATLVKALKELQRSSAQEQEVSDRFYSEPSRDCFTFNKECEGCRGYLDSCCSSKNCGSGRVCKQGVFSYSCDDPNTESSELAIGTSPSSKHDVESDVGRVGNTLKDWPVCFPDATKKAHEYCDLRTKTGCSFCKHGHYWFWGATYCCKPTDYYSNDCRCYTSEEEIAAMESSELAIGTSASKAQPADDGGCYNMCRETGASMEQCARKCPMPGETVVEHDDSTVEEEEVGRTNPWPCRDTNKVGHGRSMKPGQHCNTDWAHVSWWRARHEYCKNDKGNWGCQFGYKRVGWFNDYCCNEWESRNTNRCKCR